MIPEEKIAAVTRGLQEAFGATTCDETRLLTTPPSASRSFQIIVGGTPYLLRVLTRTDSVHDPTRQFAFMKAADDAGLAPHVWYSSIEDGICITDFVETVPLTAHEALASMPEMLRKLHALPPYSKALNYVTVDQSIRRFQAANLLPKCEIDEIFEQYDRLSAVYPCRDSDMVSCHNDLKPENILFDGRRAWLVAWKAAFRNDRYFDLAVIANFVITDETEERAFLDQYFGQPPSEYQLARFFLMRQVMHMLYSAFFLLLGAAGKPVDESVALPAFCDLHRRIWDGEVNLGDNDLKTVYARVHWKRLIENTRHTRFEEALRIVSDGNVGGPERARRLLPTDRS